MPPAAPRLTPEPGIVVEAPKAVAGKFCDDDLLIFWNRHGDDSANGPLYAMAAIGAGFPDEAKTLATMVKALDPMDAQSRRANGWKVRQEAATTPIPPFATAQFRRASSNRGSGKTQPKS